MALFVIFAPHSQIQTQFRYDLLDNHRNEVVKSPVRIVHVAINQVTTMAKDMVRDVAVMVKDHKC